MGCCNSSPIGEEPTTLPCAIQPFEQPITRRLLPLLWLPQGRSSLPLLREHVRTTLLRSAASTARGCTVIPHALRWWAYQHLSGGAELEATFPGLYRLLLHLGPSKTQDLTIRFDAHRTFPYMPFFGTASRPGPGQSQLYRIAVAYSHLDPALGYTQGCNFIIALLLLAGLSEEAAFYAFAGLLLRLRLRLFYGHGLPLAMAALGALEALLRARAPVLQAHLEAQGVLPVLYATPWLLSFWVSSPLPASTLLCCMDLLLLEAPPLDPAPPPLAVTAYAAALEAEAERGQSRRALSSTAASLQPAAAPCTLAPVVEVVTVLDVPPVYLRICLALVLIREDALLAADDTDSVYAVLKDEYAPLHTLRPAPSETVATLTRLSEPFRHRGSTVGSNLGTGVNVVGGADSTVSAEDPPQPSKAPSGTTPAEAGVQSAPILDSTDRTPRAEELVRTHVATSLADGSIAGQELVALLPFAPALESGPARHGSVVATAAPFAPTLHATEASPAMSREPAATESRVHLTRASDEPTPSPVRRIRSTGSVFDRTRSDSGAARTQRLFPAVTVAFNSASVAILSTAEAVAHTSVGRRHRCRSADDALLLHDLHYPAAAPRVAVRRHSDPAGHFPDPCSRRRRLQLLTIDRAPPRSAEFRGRHPRRLAPIQVAVKSTEATLPRLHDSDIAQQQLADSDINVTHHSSHALANAVVVERTSDDLPSRSGAPSRSVCEPPAEATIGVLILDAAPAPSHPKHGRWHFQFPATLRPNQMPGRLGSSAHQHGSSHIDGGRGVMPLDGDQQPSRVQHRRVISRLPSAPMLRPPSGTQRQAAPSFALKPEASMRDFGSAVLPIPRRREGGHDSPGGGSPSVSRVTAESAGANASPTRSASMGALLPSAARARAVSRILGVATSTHATPAALRGSPSGLAAEGLGAEKSVSVSPPQHTEQASVGAVASALDNAATSARGRSINRPSSLLPGGVHAPRKLAIFEPSEGCSMADWLRDPGGDAVAQTPRASVLQLPALGVDDLHDRIGSPAGPTQQSPPPLQSIVLPPLLSPPAETSASQSAAPTHVSSLAHAVVAGGSVSSESEEESLDCARVAPEETQVQGAKNVRGPHHAPDMAWAAPATDSSHVVPDAAMHRPSLHPVLAHGAGVGSSFRITVSRGGDCVPPPPIHAASCSERIIADGIEPLRDTGMRASRIAAPSLDMTPSASIPGLLPGSALSPTVEQSPLPPPCERPDEQTEETLRSRVARSTFESGSSATKLAKVLGGDSIGMDSAERSGDAAAKGGVVTELPSIRDIVTAPGVSAEPTMPPLVAEPAPPVLDTSAPTPEGLREHDSEAASMRISAWVCDGKPCSEWALPRSFVARLQERDVSVRSRDLRKLLKNQ